MGYLLPFLGYAPGKRAGKARLADFSLDLLVFLRWLVPFLRKESEGADIVVSAACTGECLVRHVHKLARYLTILGARCGVLTNGEELRIYERLPDGAIELLFQCVADELESRAEDVRNLLENAVVEEESEDFISSALEAALGAVSRPTPETRRCLYRKQPNRIPSDLRPFANQGLNNVKHFAGEVNEYRESIDREPLTVLGVLPSKIPTNPQYLKHSFPRQKQAIPDRYAFPPIESVIYERMPLATSLSHTRKEREIEIPDPKSIFEFCAMEASASAGQSADDFESLADEILTKTGLNE